MKQAGNTLIELLIATVIVGLVLTAVAMTMMYSIQREATNRYREYATQLAVETNEFLYLRRAILGWQGFRDTYTPGGATTTYCFHYPDLSTDPQLAGGACTPTEYMNQYNIPFATDVEIVQDDATKLTATITVRANVGDPNEFTYEVTQYYTEREY